MNESVIVCTRNRHDLLLRFCGSLFCQTRLPSELIIVDSSDEPLTSSADFGKLVFNNACSIPVKYKHSEPGLTLQRNIGIGLAHGDILYFFDDDIVLESNYLEVLSTTFEQNPQFYGGMGTITNWVELTFSRRVTLFAKSLFMLQRRIGDGKFRPSGFPHHPYGRNRFLEVEVLGGGLTGYRKQIFEEFSFDENLSGYASQEDVDFSRRVSFKYKLFYNPLARCQHLHYGSNRAGSPYNYFRMMMKNYRYLFYKNIYPRNRFSLLAHWWAIAGLFILGKSPTQIKAYFHGLRDNIKDIMPAAAHKDMAA